MKHIWQLLLIATALLLGLTTQAEASLNLKAQFSAVGDCVADDTTAVQNWLDAASQSDADLYAPTGCYRVVGQRVRSGVALSMRGDGRGLTIFEFEGGGFSFPTGSAGRTISIQDITILAKQAGQGAAIKLEWPSAGSVYYHQGSVSRVEIAPKTTTGAYFTRGLRITNGWNLELRDIVVAGSPGSPLAMASGIFFDGGGVDNTISHAHIAYTNRGVEVEPTSVSEGLRVLDSTFLVVGWGVYAVTTTGSGTQTRVIDCHINAIDGGIYLDRRAQSVITQNLIYKFSSSTSNFLAIYVVRSNDVIIFANQIIRTGADNSDNGIVISESMRAQAMHNLPTGMDTGIWMQAGSNNGQVVDNQGDSNGQMVADQGSNNLIRDNRQ